MRKGLGLKRTEPQTTNETTWETILNHLRKPAKHLRDFAIVKPLGALGGVIIVVAVLVAIVGPLLTHHDPIATNIGMRNKPPNMTFLLGTDMFGRDVLSRLMSGARISLLVGLTAAALGVIGGGIIGIISAYVGGTIDMAIQRVVDIMMSFPTLILAIALVAVLGTGLDKVILAIGVINAARSVRILRSGALSIKHTIYVRAARVVGCSHWRIVLRHILPNTVAPFIVLYSAVFGAAIITEASLSYLGLGVPPPNSSWGGMLTNAHRFVRSAPWVVLSAGIPIVLVVLGSNLLGDALRDYLDPRLRRVQRRMRNAV